jgi:hypothetical protein
VVETVGATSQYVEANMSYSLLLQTGAYITLGFYDFNPANVNTDGRGDLARFTIVRV